MTKVTEFNRSNLKDIRKAIEKALNEVGEQFDISMDIGNISFNSGTFTTKLTAKTGGAGKDIHEMKYAEDWNRYHAMFDLDKEWLGKEVKVSAQVMGTIVGLAPKSTKYPVIVKKSSGGLVKMMESSIKSHFRNNPAPKVSTPRPNLTKLPELNDNERIVYGHIKQLVINKNTNKITMDELLKSLEHSDMKDTSIMVYVGNLKKKNRITRDSQKNIILINTILKHVDF